MSSKSSNGGPANRRPPVAETFGVWKAFGETQALKDVSIDITVGECHGLVGRNGAGKSTLVSILTGLTRPDRGTVHLGGVPVVGTAGRARLDSVVACVYQKSMVVPTLTVAENVFLNRLSGNGGTLVNWGRVRAQSRQVMLDWGFDLDVDRLVGDLTVEQRQVVEIARALSIGARFLILDEPTASLEKAAIERLFARIRRLKESGVGIMYISHHLEEIYEVCDRVTVLRDGERVLDSVITDVTLSKLVGAMVGSPPDHRDTEIPAAKRPVDAAAAGLRVTSLRVESATGSVDDVSLEVATGECLGLVGLRGSGSATLADAVVGLVKPRSGEISVNGKRLRPGKVDDAVARGIGYVPEDRHSRGFSPLMGLGENITLPVLDRISRWGLMSFAAQRRRASEQVERFGIVSRGLDQPVRDLSGGNQQKATVGRALASNPSVLVAVAPTVGVDVASKDALLNTIAKARVDGMAVLLVSDDLEDLRICTRLLVMVRGRITKEFSRPPWDRHQLISAVEGLDAASVGGQS